MENTAKKSRVQYQNKVGCGCILTNVWDVWDDPNVVGKMAIGVRTTIQLCATHHEVVQAQEV